MRTRMTAILTWWLLLAVGIAHAETEFELGQAEKLALENDPLLKAMSAQQDAFQSQAVADNTLPDPKMKVGFVNFPTDTFDRTQEPMTQILVGVSQVIPRGDTLALKSRRAYKSGEATAAKRDNRARMLQQEVRTVYLELAYWQQAEEQVQHSKALFRKLVDITQSQYSSGMQRQQEVIRAELELDMLEDRLDEIRNKQQVQRAQLSKLLYVPEQNLRAKTTLPPLPAVSVPADQLASLKSHPLIRQQDAEVANGQYDIELARQEYKPDWMFELAYGFRDGTNPGGGERADFLSAVVTFDVPLFTGDRQDQKVAANRYRYQAAMESREDELRKLQSQLQETLATWGNLQERINRFQNSIVPQARENAKASLHAYQNRGGDFTALMRARITELETELKYSRLQADYLKTQAKLLYLLGEQQ